jgi:hypothetical protein
MPKSKTSNMSGFTHGPHLDLAMNHTNTWSKIETQNLLEESLKHITRNVQKQMFYVQKIQQKDNFE